jgi:[ribosomal protein S5]-alanine N-acetyltransferase
MLRTERLVLRKPRLDDAHWIFERYARDAEVTRYLTWQPYTDSGPVEDFVRRKIVAWDGTERRPWVITLRDDDRPIGMLEVRLWRAHWVDNVGSQRVLEKSGMVREGRLARYIVHPNVDAEPRDVFVYAAVR